MASKQPVVVHRRLPVVPARQVSLAAGRRLHRQQQVATAALRTAWMLPARLLAAPTAPLRVRPGPRARLQAAPQASPPRMPAKAMRAQTRLPATGKRRTTPLQRVARAARLQRVARGRALMPRQPARMPQQAPPAVVTMAAMAATRQPTQGTPLRAPAMAPRL